MKKIFVIFIGLFILFSFNCCADETKTIAAVMDLETQEGVSQGNGNIISDYLRTQLVNTNRYIIVTRENMEQILEEQNFQMSGCTSEQCIVQMGQLLGVRKIFAGSLGKLGSTYVINLKIIDVESGKIEKAVSEQCPKCEVEALLSSIDNIANKVIEPTPFLAEKQPHSIAKKVGTYEAMTIPDGADVYFDGELKGQTPFLLKDISPGIHKARFVKEGYKDVESQFMIFEGKSTSKKYTLDKKEETQVKEKIIFKNRLGLGVNYPGVQIRYGLMDSLLIEGKAQFSSNNTTIGGRAYYILMQIPGNVSLLPYLGAGFSWVISPYLMYGGYVTGGFAGLELMVMKNVGLGADAGIYYVKLMSSRGSIDDYGLLFNFGVTYYF